MRMERNTHFWLVTGTGCDWMRKNGLSITPEMDMKMSKHENQGQTAVLCAINGRCSSCMVTLVIW